MTREAVAGPDWGRDVDEVLDRFADFLDALGGAVRPRPGRDVVVEVRPDLLLINARVDLSRASGAWSAMRVFLDVRAVLDGRANVLEYSFHLQADGRMLVGLHLDAAHGAHVHDPDRPTDRRRGDPVTLDTVLAVVRERLGER